MIADGFLELGQLYLEKGNLPEARKALDLASRRVDDSSDLRFALAQLEEKKAATPTKRCANIGWR